jgi:hypothetical protein
VHLLAQHYGDGGFGGIVGRRGRYDNAGGNVIGWAGQGGAHGRHDTKRARQYDRNDEGRYVYETTEDQTHDEFLLYQYPGRLGWRPVVFDGQSIAGQLQAGMSQKSRRASAASLMDR